MVAGHGVPTLAGQLVVAENQLSCANCRCSMSFLSFNLVCVCCVCSFFRGHSMGGDSSVRLSNQERRIEYHRRGTVSIVRVQTANSHCSSICARYAPLSYRAFNRPAERPIQAPSATVKYDSRRTELVGQELFRSFSRVGIRRERTTDSGFEPCLLTNLYTNAKLGCHRREKDR